MNGGAAPARAARDVLLVDPSLFTAPYDAALSGGLRSIGIEPHWATRGLRPNEEDELGAARSLDIFYPLTDGSRRRTGGLWRVLKGLEHAVGMRTLLRLVRTGKFDLVHFQWALVPLIDARVIGWIRKSCPVVITVHDTTPFNGKQVSRLQRGGFDTVLDSADRIIVHTRQGRATLIERGSPAERIDIVPHGMLTGGSVAASSSDGRWRIVLFGKLQDYKGLDVLVEALGLLPEAERRRLSVIVAGEPLNDVAPLVARAEALGIDAATLQFRLFRHSQAEMDSVLGEADTFVFPYRAIEASGVLFAVAPLGKWLVASDLGAFAEMIGRADDAGTLVAPGDAQALASALVASIGRRPTRDIAADVPSWTTIATMTEQVYSAAISAWRDGALKAAA